MAAGDLSSNHASLHVATLRIRISLHDRLCHILYGSLSAPLRLTEIRPRKSPIRGRQRFLGGVRRIPSADHGLQRPDVHPLNLYHLFWSFFVCVRRQQLVDAAISVVAVNKAGGAASGREVILRRPHPGRRGLRAELDSCSLPRPVLWMRS